MAVVVDVRDAVKVFGAVRAVDGVTLSVNTGEVVALLGPNGAGKTTCVSLMIGLRKPTSGSATLFGFTPADVRARSRCGVMLQESGLPSFLTVRETIDLFRTYYPAPLAADAVIDLIGLEEKARAQVHTLSGGQQQRLYFGLAMCGNPELLFLDEPTVGLDVEARRGFWTHVKAFVRSGRTVVLTTHYLEEADALADRIAVINQGEIIAEGTPAEIKAQTSGKRIRCLTALSIASLLQIPGVTDVRQDREAVEIHAREAEPVVRSLLARDSSLSGLEITSAGLEEAFLALTKDNGENANGQN